MISLGFTDIILSREHDTASERIITIIILIRQDNHFFPEKMNLLCTLISSIDVTDAPRDVELARHLPLFFLASWPRQSMSSVPSPSLFLDFSLPHRQAKHKTRLLKRSGLPWPKNLSSSGQPASTRSRSTSMAIIPGRIPDTSSTLAPKLAITQGSPRLRNIRLSSTPSGRSATPLSLWSSAPVRRCLAGPEQRLRQARGLQGKCEHQDPGLEVIKGAQKKNSCSCFFLFCLKSNLSISVEFHRIQKTYEVSFWQEQ